MFKCLKKLQTLRFPSSQMCNCLGLELETHVRSFAMPALLALAMEGVASAHLFKPRLLLQLELHLLRHVQLAVATEAHRVVVKLEHRGTETRPVMAGRNKT